MDSEKTTDNVSKTVSTNNAPNTPKTNIKKTTPTKKISFKFWFYLIIALILFASGTYGYLKYNNNILEFTSQIKALIPFQKTQSNSLIKKNNPDSDSDFESTSPELLLDTPKDKSNTNSKETDTQYNKILLMLSEKIDSINKELSLKKINQEKYTKITNRFNLIYALEHGEAPLSLLQMVSSDVQSESLKKQLNSLANFSHIGIPTLNVLEKEFNSTIYSNIYLQSLKANHSALGIIKYYFAKLIMIQNFDNATISNPKDIRIKLNLIQHNLANSNIEKAYTLLKQIDDKILSKDSLKWKQKLESRYNAVQVIKILKTYN